LWSLKSLAYNNKNFKGAQFFHLRTSCYKHVTHMLKTLMGSSANLSHNSTALPIKPGPPAPPDTNQLDPSEASQHAKQVIFCLH